jgi:hypothetical protein
MGCFQLFWMSGEGVSWAPRGRAARSARRQAGSQRTVAVGKSSSPSPSKPTTLATAMPPTKLTTHGSTWICSFSTKNGASCR